MSKFSKFRRIFFGILFALILLSWVFLWIFVRDYENNVSIQKVKQVVAQYQEADGEGLMSHLDIKLNKYESFVNFSNYIEYIVGGAEVKYVMVTSSLSENPEYLISIGDTVIEKLVLEPNGKTRLGHKKWEIASEETSCLPLYDITINAPTNAQIFINEIPLSEIPTDEGMVLGLYENTPKGEYMPLFNNYVISGFYEIPTITAVGANGEECIITKDDETGTNFNIVTPATEEQYQIITKTTESFSANYYKYISGEEGFEVLSPYIYENSEFYEYIKSQNVKKLTGHDSSRLESIRTSNYRSYDSTQVSCEVSFNFIYTVDGMEYKYPSAYEINYIKVGDEYKVAALVAK